MGEAWGSGPASRVMEPIGRVRCHGGVADDGTIEWLTLDPTPDVRSEAAMEVSAAPGDAAFARLYAEQFDPLVRLAALLVGSPAAAEDVVQDSFAKLHGRFHRIDEPRAWLRVAVVNASRNERRRLGRLRRHLARQSHRREPMAVAGPPPEPPDASLLAALRRLPPRQRAVVVLRYYLGLDEAEIASTLGIRPGTVKSRLHRALAQLRVELGPPQDEGATEHETKEASSDAGAD